MLVIWGVLAIASSATASVYMGFHCSSVGKESAYHTEDLGSIPRSGRSPGEGSGNPLKYSCQENPMDRRAWQAIVHGVTRVEYAVATKPPPPSGYTGLSEYLFAIFVCLSSRGVPESCDNFIFDFMRNDYVFTTWHHVT